MSAYEKKRSSFPIFETVSGLLVFFIHYSTSVSISIYGVSALLIIPLISAVSYFHKETYGLFYGLLFGLLFDSAASGTTCFYTLFFTVAGFLFGILADHFFNRNVYSAVFQCFIISLLFFILKWLIFVFIPYGDRGFFELVFRALPSAVYTAVFSVPLYFAEKHLFKREE